MNNIISYIGWRGDLTLGQSPFCEVDNLILSELCYLDLTGIVPPPGEGDIALSHAADAYFAAHPVPDPPPDNAAHSNVNNEWLLYLAGQSRRFGGMRLSGWVDVLDHEAAKQFGALCIQINGSQLYVAYRGTSDDLAGWKEDFLLACLPETPSQGEALRYLEHVAALHPDMRLIPGGHSKGGNLAVYAAALASLELQSRITAVWSNDGPGFHEDFIASDGYRRISKKLHAIVPKSSVVGMLLAHGENSRIVDSSQLGLLQHDGFSWEVFGDHFVALPALTAESLHADLKIRAWVDDMPLDKRRQFVDALFDVLYASGATTLSAVQDDWLKALRDALPFLRAQPKETRDQIIQFLVLLRTISRRLTIESRMEKSRSRGA
ncbi:MAG: DUF2974 domain-containing protein [Clostridia bacterium]|nr:DUF2974 domain-containing protein [Clostridia bacterium]